MVQVLQADLPGDPAKPLSASGKLAALLLTNRVLAVDKRCVERENNHQKSFKM
jgi:hypothetical protein